MIRNENRNKRVEQLVYLPRKAPILDNAIMFTHCGTREFQVITVLIVAILLFNSFGFISKPPLQIYYVQMYK